MPVIPRLDKREIQMKADIESLRSIRGTTEKQIKDRLKKWEREFESEDVNHRTSTILKHCEAFCNYNHSIPQL